MKFLKIIISFIVFFIQNSISEHFSLDESNFIIISGPITRSNVDFFIKQLYTDNIQNYMNINKKIIFYIDSPGGSVHEGMRLIQTMHSLQQNNITIDCIAENFMSMAFIIFQVCDSRNILHHSIGMQHQMNLALRGDIENVKSYFDMINKMNQQMITMEIQRIGISYPEYYNKIIQDWWLYGSDIIHHNVADLLVTVDCHPSLTFINKIRNENLLGFSLKIKSSACPLIKEKTISDSGLYKYFNESNYMDSKLIREINSI